MTGLLLMPVLLLVTIQTTECLRCYTCNNVIDDSVCTGNITTCGPGQSCYKSTRLVNGTEVINLGCVDNQQCSNTTSIGNIVGREVYKRQTHTCMECCAGDMCNVQLCTYHKLTECTDDESVNCARLNSIMGICSNVQYASEACPRFCGLCNAVDGEWSTWSEWSHCDVSCSNGTVTRTRSCTNPRPEHGGIDCVGNTHDVRSCYTATICPVHGGWSAWYNWESCSTSCDSGIQRRARNCTNPKPAYSGDNCFGPNRDARMCSNGPCADGGWSTWSSWSKCSTTCGVGIHSKHRACNNPVPSHDGQYCIGDPSHVDTCNIDQDCSKPTIDGGWSTWSSWSKCSTTCGVGRHSQYRACNNPEPSHDGQYCIGDPTRVHTCNINQGC